MCQVLGDIIHGYYLSDSPVSVHGSYGDYTHVTEEETIAQRGQVIG